ncbi:Transcription factor CBF/NF-Y/archaeal histone domain [Dillenia turbinata]|uniref:Transcription factor CBF/NF-Y/archaeal histone domain n=1 Tax=Dillenia turbinata TaxID=194707 RepID=A0AAN8VI85_9MAGN
MANNGVFEELQNLGNDDVSLPPVNQQADSLPFILLAPPSPPPTMVAPDEVNRMIEHSLPGSSKISANAKNALHDCAIKPIAQVAQAADEICHFNSPKIMRQEDVEVNLSDHNFDGFAQTTKPYFKDDFPKEKQPELIDFLNSNNFGEGMPSTVVEADAGSRSSSVDILDGPLDGGGEWLSLASHSSAKPFYKWL